MDASLVDFEFWVAICIAKKISTQLPLIWFGLRGKEVLIQGNKSRRGKQNLSTRRHPSAQVGRNSSFQKHNGLQVRNARYTVGIPGSCKPKSKIIQSLGSPLKTPLKANPTHTQTWTMDTDHCLTFLPAQSSCENLDAHYMNILFSTCEPSHKPGREETATRKICGWRAASSCAAHQCHYKTTTKTSKRDWQRRPWAAQKA